ncbi:MULTISPECIES: Qat anti-phage system QueC-like protein QatC [unclassified Aeromicrobium]|uniref:Qat anti-phage system QueC-like protein QatC n=1 Tax=unclassified Aeromicrobium TaxID=2633570 RepID=UPI00396AFD00
MRYEAKLFNPKNRRVERVTNGEQVGLYAPASSARVSAGSALLGQVRRAGLTPATQAWDFLSVALTALAADADTRRSASADGWTREFELVVPVSDPDRWAAHAPRLSEALSFLTTDRWSLEFTAGKVPYSYPVGKKAHNPVSDCVALLSGGLDSLIGGVDLVGQKKSPFFVSQSVRGDEAKQVSFARTLGGEHLVLNHNVATGRQKETTQRARSMAFIAYGALAATTLFEYAFGSRIPLYVSENGYICINPPLTPLRVGSLSTRTAHPRFLRMVQDVFDGVGIEVDIINPYRFKTKGEMMAECADVSTLVKAASASTSCGRFQRFNYTHCGRCLPCQVRRAAFLAADIGDATDYIFEDLGRDDEEHARFDDVRSVGYALSTIDDVGVNRWLGSSLSGVAESDRPATRDMIARAVAELGALHATLGVT